MLGEPSVIIMKLTFFVFSGLHESRIFSEAADVEEVESGERGYEMYERRREPRRACVLDIYTPFTWAFIHQAERAGSCKRGVSTSFHGFSDASSHFTLSFAGKFNLSLSSSKTRVQARWMPSKCHGEDVYACPFNLGALSRLPMYPTPSSLRTGWSLSTSSQTPFVDL